MNNENMGLGTSSVPTNNNTNNQNTLGSTNMNPGIPTNNIGLNNNMHQAQPVNNNPYVQTNNVGITNEVPQAPAFNSNPFIQTSTPGLNQTPAPINNNMGVVSEAPKVATIDPFVEKDNGQMFESNVGGFGVTPPSSNLIGGLEPPTPVVQTPPTEETPNKKLKNMPIKAIIAGVLVLVVGLVVGVNFFLFAPKVIIENSIDEMFATSNDIILDVDNFLSEIDTSSDYEVINKLSMNTNVEGFNVFNDFTLTVSSMISDSKMYSDLDINYKNNSVLNIKLSETDNVLKLLFNTYDKIIEIDTSDLGLDNEIYIEELEKMLETISIENAIYINDFLNRVTKESIDYDKITKEKRKVTLNNETVSVTSYDYAMSLNDTVICFLEAIKNDKKIIEIITAYDITESELLEFINESVEDIKGEEEEIFTFSFYTKGIMKKLVGGELIHETIESNFYIEDDVIYLTVYESDYDFDTRKYVVDKDSYYKYVIKEDEVTLNPFRNGESLGSLSVYFSNTRYGFKFVEEGTLVEGSIENTSSNNYLTEFKVEDSGETAEIKLETEIKYDFEFVTMPNQTVININDIDNEEALEIGESIVYAFEDTSIGKN